MSVEQELKTLQPMLQKCIHFGINVTYSNEFYASISYILKLVKNIKHILKHFVIMMRHVLHHYGKKVFIRQFGFEKLDDEPHHLKFCPSNLVIQT
jgi:formylmethanofuran dehydrogenase subunit B